MTKTPVVVLAYNRPQYLDKCLNSIKKQSSGRDIHLFIDGPRSQEDQIVIQQSVSLSRQKISNIEIHISQEHLGPHLLNKRARDTVFENNDRAVFVAENLAINDYYLEQIVDFYFQAVQSGNDVGAVTCYPANQQSIEFQSRFKSDVTVSNSMLAYLLTRDAYDKIYDSLDEYYSIVGRNYSDQTIHLLRYKLGLSNRFNGSIQDMTLYSLIKNDLSYFSTVTNNLIDLDSPNNPVFNEKVTEFYFKEGIKKENKDFLTDYFKNSRDYRDFRMKVF